MLFILQCYCLNSKDISSYCQQEDTVLDGSSMAVFGTAVARVLSLEISLAPSMCEVTVAGSSVCGCHRQYCSEVRPQEQQGCRRGCSLLLQTSFIDSPLVCLQALSPKQCPKQPNTCCRDSQTGLPLTGPSTRWLTFWVLEPRPGSPAVRLP